DPAAINQADKLILPGVGHFGQMIRSLDVMNLREALIEKIQSGTPFLGICLGLQALFTSSEEAPDCPGLGIFQGTIRRFTGDLRIPHMGWNRLNITRASRLLDATGDAPYAYFANSYYAPLTVETTASCEYGVIFTAIVEHANISAVQFHPEK